MKIKNHGGEYLFRALIWGRLTHRYYSSKQEVIDTLVVNPMAVKWPAEELSPGCIYIPSEEELNEEE